ncbi:MAG: choice-of-anchor D domain-containing protein [Acidobacteria bacterium]|nr:choice-of-anchor D domain-containing protein [Acidobacteriota bacterium]
MQLVRRIALALFTCGAVSLPAQTTITGSGRLELERVVATLRPSNAPVTGRQSISQTTAGFSLTIRHTSTADNVTVSLALDTAPLNFSYVEFAGGANGEVRFTPDVAVKLDLTVQSATNSTSLVQFSEGPLGNPCRGTLATSTTETRSCRLTTFNTTQLEGRPVVTIPFTINTSNMGFWNVVAYFRFGAGPKPPDITISDNFPAIGEKIWGPPALMPQFSATVDYTAPTDAEVTVELVNTEELIIQYRTVNVPAGAGTLVFSFPQAPFRALTLAETEWRLRAVLLTKAPDGKPVFTTSNVINYTLVLAPGFEGERGCMVGVKFDHFAQDQIDAGAVIRGCSPGIRLLVVHEASSGVTLSGLRQGRWGQEDRGSFILPPIDLDGLYLVDIALEPFEVYPPTNIDNYQVRFFAINKGTAQIVRADPITVPVEAVNITGCVPAPESFIPLAATDVTCTVEASTWRSARALMRSTQKVGKDLVTTLDPQTHSAFADQFKLAAGDTLDGTQTQYYLAPLTANDTYTAKSRAVFFRRIPQSLDDAIVTVGRDRVSDFISGSLTIANGLALPGKLGSVARKASDICSGASTGTAKGLAAQAMADFLSVATSKKADCLSKAQAALEQFLGRGAARAAGAASNLLFLPIASTWTFDTPQPSGGAFAAALKLQYTAEALPAHPEFDESKLRLISWDPDTGVFEILPSTLDLTTRTVTTSLRSLAPYYTLAMIEPAQKSYLRSPIVLAGSSLSSSLALNNPAASAGSFSFNAYDSEGASAGGQSVPQPLTAGASAQATGTAATILNPQNGRASGWVEVTAERTEATGVQVLSGGGVLDVLPLEKERSNSWLLSVVEQDENFTTQIHLANSANAYAPVTCDLRRPDGTSAGVWTGNIEPKGKLSLSLSAMFPGLPTPFRGYLSVIAEQDITAAALLQSSSALDAVAGKLALPPSAQSRLYAPVVGAASIAARLSLVNLGTQSASVTVRGFSSSGVAANPYTTTIRPLAQFSASIAEMFGATAGPLSIRVESPQPGLIGDIILTDAGAQGRARTSIPLSSSPSTSLQLPYAPNDTTAQSSIVLTNTATAPATVTLTYASANGARTATVNLAANASSTQPLSALFGANATNGYLEVSATQPVTAAATLATRTRDIAAVPAIPAASARPINPASPTIATSPSSLDFGALPVGQRRDLTLTVSNTGTAPLTISSPAFSSPLFTLVSPTFPVTLAAAAQQVLTIRYAPTAAGSHSATFTILSNDPNRASVAIPLAGRGDAPAPVISIAPANLDFGAVSVGQTRQLSITVRNTGAANLQVSATSNSTFFTVAPGTLAVAAGSQQTFAVTFRPDAATARTGTLTITSNDPVNSTLSVPMTGTGAAIGGGAGTILSIDKGSFEITAGFPAGGVTATFVNRLTPGSYPATLRSVLVFFPSGELPLNTPVTILAAANPTGAGGAQLTGLNFQSTNASITAQESFLEIPVNPLTITSGDFLVGFSAINPAGVYPVVVDTVASRQRSYISSDGAVFRLLDSTAIGSGNFGIRARIDGGATAGSGSSLTVNPSSIAFGSVPVGTPSQPRQILITNNGSTTLNITLSAAPPFSVNPAAVSALTPGGAATAFLTYTPISSTPAQQNGSLTIASAGSTLATVSLSGSPGAVSTGGGGTPGSGCAAGLGTSAIPGVPPRPTCATLDTSSALATSLAGLFLMNEGSGAATRNLVSGALGSFAGPSAPIWNAAEPSLNFLGGVSNNSYVDFGTDLAFDRMPVNRFTIVAKIFVPTLGLYGIAEKNDRNVADGFLFAMDNAGNLKFTVEKSTTNLRVTAGGGAIRPNQWVQVAVTWDGAIATAAAARLYVNGVEQQKSSAGDGVGVLGFASATNQPFRIGTAAFDGLGSFNGRMAYLAVYNGRILNPAEMTQLDTRLPIR